MRKAIVWAVTAAIAVVVMAAPASLASSTKDQYSHAYYQVRNHTSQSPGRNIRRQGLRGGKRAKKADYLASLQTLSSILHPAPMIVAAHVASTPGSGTVVSASAPSSVSPGSGLAQCIIQRESGGNPQATNGGHSGVGQWDQGTWVAQGGTQYGATPLDASKGDQIRVLNNALAHGQEGAWRPYDGC